MPAFSLLALRLWRLGALLSAGVLLHVAERRQRPAGGEAGAVSLEQARHFFPDAARLEPAANPAGAADVYSAGGERLGAVLTTAPESAGLIGYAGPSDVLVALGRAGEVTGLEILSSGDTPAHVEAVRADPAFAASLRGWHPPDSPPPVAAVSGSTLTSLAMLEGVEWKLAGGQTAGSLRFPEALSLGEIQALFPAAASFSPDPRPGWHRVLGADGSTLGFAVRTAPASDNIRGYAGPSESLAGVAPDGQHLTGLRPRRSYDSPDYVERVWDGGEYEHLLTAGRTVDEWAGLDFAAAGIEGVSGATLTSYAVAEGLRRRFATPAPAEPPLVPAWLPGLLLLGGAGLMAFTRLRSSPRLRIAWQAVLIGWFGWKSADLLSLALLAGWSRHGLVLSVPAFALAAAALLVPWATRRQLHCHHICPHGALQEWLGKCRRLHRPLPAHWHRRLLRVPGLLLALAFLLLVTGTAVDLAAFEPFDAWSLKIAATASAVLAVLGLAVSVFIPQAYCHYGCPTGALLKFLRTTGRADRFGPRDWAALSLLLPATVFLLAAAPAAKPEPSALRAAGHTTLSGNAFGTFWSVKLPHTPPDAAALRTALAAELGRIESTLSHWRPDSATARFNATATTWPMDVPAELVALVIRAQQVSEATGGVFDITVGPLVRAWGYGPGSDPAAAAPDGEMLAGLRAACGWEKLHADPAAGTLQKAHPALQIDLGALLQGYGADRLADLLRQRGETRFLIDCGGELRAAGTWPVAIEDPARPGQPLLRISLTDAALATSGIQRASRRDPSGTVHSHLIDPRTGRPVSAPPAFTSVLAPLATDADLWATALSLLPPDEAAALAARHSLRLWQPAAGLPPPPAPSPQ